ncbi:MAG: S9 family peptidase [Calditrichaeota bacterium]|nr:MAG: S9 family peptidase [Calditrichota bacterium]
MKLKMLFILALLLIGIETSYAQKKQLTLEDVAFRWRTELAPERLQQLQWIDREDEFFYIDEVDSVETLFKGIAFNGKVNSMLNLTQLNSLLEKLEGKPVKHFPKLHWIDDNRCWFWGGDSMYVLDVRKKSLSVYTHFTGQHNNEDVAIRTLAVAFTRENNLFILQKNGKEVQVTRDTIPGIVNGESVHRNEFGIYKGTFWSPKNNYLAFYRKDERMVTDYPYVDFTTRPATAKPGKYPMAGMKNHIASIGVYHLKSGRTVWLNTGEPADQYLTNVTWSPDEKFIYVAQINRDQNHMRLIKYDVQTGEPAKQLFEEKEERYVEPMTGPFFIGNDPERFLWLSMRDGWNHIYLYKEDGTLVKQLTKGDWDVVSIDGADPSGKYVYFTAARQLPIQRNLYRVNLKNNRIERLTSENGTHRCQISYSGKYFLDEFSSLNTPGWTRLASSDGKTIRKLLTSSNPLKDYQVGQREILPLKVNEQLTLYSRLIYPFHFDSTRTYPLIVYVYGGPHSQQVRDTWLGGSGSWNLWLHYLANQGYIIFTVDNRGTRFRGKAFEQETFRRLGTVEVMDQVAALKQILTRPYVDSSRVGVIGWSYGGFMATSLMLRAPEIFKAGIAGAPVIDWRYYETIYTERYMDTPETNPEGYEAANTRKYIDNLRGKLFLIHGTSDNIVMWQHTILFLQSAIKAGKQPDYFVYPGHQHGIRGKDRLHLLTRMTEWFRENL